MEAAGPYQMLRQGYRLCSRDGYQPGVRRTSPPYLITLLYPIRHYRSELECPMKSRKLI